MCSIDKGWIIIAVNGNAIMVMHNVFDAITIYLWMNPYEQPHVYALDSTVWPAYFLWFQFLGEYV